MRCGTCGSMLYTNGTCPLCDRPPRQQPQPAGRDNVVELRPAIELEPRRAA